MSNLATIGWPSGTDAGWPSEPRNMLPGRIEGYPQGSQRSANTAERLLSQAVGWWDAAFYRPGDRLLRNRGVAGDLLDLQLGSSDRVATSNDPLFLAPEDSGYVYLPGVAGNFLSVPDEAALDITGDIDIRALVTLDDWTPAANSTLLGKYKSTAASDAYFFRINTNGRPFFQWRNAALTAISVDSGAAVSAADGDRLWVRVTLDIDNGASPTPAYEVKFYTSPASDGVNWTQLGNTSTGATTTSINAGSEPLVVGARSDSSTEPLTGRIYRAVIYTDLTETNKVLDVDCDAITDGSATSFTAVTGQTVTINCSTSGRKSVAVPRRNGGGRSLFLLGTDDYFQCVDNWQHQLLNFDQQDSFTVVAVVRQWATPANFGIYLDKRDGSVNGYSLRSNGTAVAPSTAVSSASISVAQAGSTFNAGTLAVLAGVINRSNNTLQTFTNDLGSPTNSISTLGSMANSFPMRIGRRADGSQYQDFEFISAAVFRRALTQAEIRVITDYYQNRGF